MSALRLITALAVTSAISSCLQVDHFKGDPTEFDNIYFGSLERAPLHPEIASDQWRLYAILGLVPWDKEQLEFAGDYLARVAPDDQPTNVHITTELTVVNALANIGASLIPFGSLLFFSRHTEVVGWHDAPAGK
jgi:hypothetical protein